MRDPVKKFRFDAGQTGRAFHARPQAKTVEQRAREFRERKKFNFLHSRAQARK